MSSHSGGPPALPHPSACNKWPRMESSRALGEALGPPSQKPHSTPTSEPGSDIEMDWSWAEPPPLPPPSPAPPARPHGRAKFFKQPSSASSHPEPTQDELFGNIAFQASQLDHLLHQVEGSCFDRASPVLEWLLENLTAFFFPRMAEIVHSFDHILIHAPDLPCKYGGLGLDPPPPIELYPPREPLAPTAPPVAPVPLQTPHALKPSASLLAQMPLAPPPCSKPSFAEVTALPGTTPTQPQVSKAHCCIPTQPPPSHQLPLLGLSWLLSC
ncbi:hypothetical protein AX15_000970 [Amanita polypyramis BW_CC]|nr:hypothetical protein AX15_000970 [Amanita polypyramis BW_CC]